MLKTEAVGKIAYKAAAPTLSHNEWEPVKFHSPWIDKKFCDMKKKKITIKKDVHCSSILQCSPALCDSVATGCHELEWQLAYF